MALLPSLLWLARHDLPVKDMLERHRLSTVLDCAPTRPVPLLMVGSLLRQIAREAGPDAPCQIVAESPDVDLMQVGRVAIGARCPAEALARISRALPFFCSHELLNLETVADGVEVRHAYGAHFDGETLHLMSQYALAVLDRICAMSGAPAPRVLQAELPAHPEHGVAHLEPWFGLDVLLGTDKRSITATLPLAVAQRHYPRMPRDRSEELKRAGLAPLRNGGGFAESVRTLVAAMLEEDEAVPSVAHVAEASGLSRRTFQRRLTEEGQSFTGLVDEVRADLARRLVAGSDAPMATVSRRLGYARPTSLNRSMMRWTGKKPSALRRRGSHE